VIDDVNKWHDLARASEHAASLFTATNGDLSASARARSSSEHGYPVGDELRVAFVVDDTYWGAAGLIRHAGGAPFTPEEVELLASLAAPIAEGFRRAMLPATPAAERISDAVGLVVLGPDGALVSMYDSALAIIERMDECPKPERPHEVRAVQAVAAAARALKQGVGGPPPRARVRTRDHAWLQLYATPLAGEHDGDVAVIIQPAGAYDIAPLVARAYGLTVRERAITRLCLEGRPTRAIAETLEITEYTVQDHLKAIFRKTGASTRGELVAQLFLEHYVPRFERVDDVGDGWGGEAIATSARGD
jgi:DNA-binding CsgD family transcriptional regulator